MIVIVNKFKINFNIKTNYESNTTNPCKGITFNVE